ncbi:DNA adenine methylase [Pseudaquabacterium pictum]|uniref:site-specific DNA-methyltransferase (adenine-specific) n=1 Tax=Pseudaquabacterium pictum TaxID=2315236 RepID=A0A480AW04_9BURK|nr:DNA adenine methylase [Rubrivivax pictus]GCL64362.1 DNA adenine methylase [Rubrivivax pictus]
MAQPLIPWIGGKRRLADRLLPLLADHEHSCYVEPFCGAAALFFFREHRCKVEVLNDINGDLVNLYRVVQHHLEEFVRQFKWALSSRQLYEWAKLSQPDTLTDIQKAARFFYLQKLGFGGKVQGRTFGTATTAPARLNLLRLEEDLSDVHLRLNGVFVEHQPWDVCVARYDRAHTMFFMDPPYWGTEGYGVDFGLQQYDRMAELMRSMKGKALVTVNDVPEMRQAFAGLTMQRVSITYTVAANPGDRKATGELIIRNW